MARGIERRLGPHTENIFKQERREKWEGHQKPKKNTVKEEKELRFRAQTSERVTGAVEEKSEGCQGSVIGNN